MDSSNEKKLYAYPLQLIEGRDAIILKRGSIELKIGGEQAAAAVQAVLSAISKGGSTEEDICNLFAAPAQPAIRELIKQLLARRMLRLADDEESLPQKVESALDVFYWHFDLQHERVAKRINDMQLAIIGVNHISHQLAYSLTASGLDNFEVIDYEFLRNLHLFNNTEELNSQTWSHPLKPPVEFEKWNQSTKSNLPNCIIATSDFGGQELLLHWNRFCIEKGIHFLPVLLQDLIGYVGPLLVPGETACLECLRSRQNANLTEAKDRRLAEKSAFESQTIIGFHPSMASVLGDIAAIELTKFYGLVPQWRVGTLIEVNLLSSKMSPHKVLRIPRCKACSTLNRRSSASLKKTSFVRRIRTE